MKKTLTLTLEYPPTIGGIATYIHALLSTFDPSVTTLMTPTALNQENSGQKTAYRVIRQNLLAPKFVWPRWVLGLVAVYAYAKREKPEYILVHHALPIGYIAVLIKIWLKIPL